MECKPSEQKENLKKLKANLVSQETIFKKQNTEIEKNSKASYTVSYLKVKKMKPFTAVEFFKENMASVVREVFPEKKVTFENIILSTRTQNKN